MSHRRINSTAVRAARFTLLSSVLLACTLLFPREASAQYRFDSWNTDNGLPQNSVLAILQTRDGYLWFTTSDGLVRFDGVRFTIFNKGNTKGLTTNRFTALCESRDGSLWAGTEIGGVLRYKEGAFRTYAAEDGLAGSGVRAIWEDNDGALFVVTQQNLSRWNGERFADVTEYLPHPEYLGSFAAATRYGGRSFWSPYGVHVFKDGRYVTSVQKEGRLSLDIMRMYEDQNETLWISTTNGGGLHRLRDGELKAFAIDGLPGADIKAVYEDRAGNVWISTEGGKLSRLKDGHITIYGADQGLSSKPTNAINVIYEDREGNIWLGTRTDGLFRMSKQIISVLSMKDGLSYDNVYPICEGRDGSIWIGTMRGGLNRYKEGAFTLYGEKSGLSNAVVASLYEDRAGFLWIGTDARGVICLKHGKSISYTKEDGLAGNTVYAIHQDREGSLWFGTRSGLTRLRERTFTTYTAMDGLADSRVQAILEDHAGNLWFGTTGGLSCRRNGVFVSYTERDGLASNNVRALYEDSEGTLWIGTYDGGMSRLKDDRLVTFTTLDGMPSNGVFQILEDRRGSLWMSCNQGIYRIRKQELNDFADRRRAYVNAISYGKRDGMLGTECNGGRQPAGCRTSDDRFWFPTQQGIAVIDPEAVQFNPEPPPVVIESCLLESEPVDLRSIVRIPPGREKLEIQYSGLSFIKPEHIRFKYRLEGLDRDWIDAGTRRTAYYAYLPSGEYTFRVIAANSDGVWNLEGASLRMVVVPPLWRTWWFSALVVLFGAAIGVLIYERRLKRLKEERARQEAFSRQLINSQESERKRIAAELHDSLGQSLAIIKNRALLGFNGAADDGIAKQHFNQISEHTAHAMEEVKEISYNLRPYLLDRLGLTKALNSMLNKVAASSGIRFDTDIDELDGLCSKDAEISLYRIVQESVNNIIKHSEATEALVVVKNEDSEVAVTVQDNGKGFAVEPGAGSSTRRGFGLMGIAERARILGARHEIHSEPGRGTTLTLKVAVKNGRGEGRDEE